MENEIGPLGQPAHNNPKQQLSYFDSLNHIESRHLDQEKNPDEPNQDWNAVKREPNSPEEKKDKNIVPNSNNYTAKS